MNQSKLNEKTDAVARLLERHLAPCNARERAGNIIQALAMHLPEDGSLEDMVRGIARGFGGGDIPEGTIAEIVGAIS